MPSPPPREAMISEFRDLIAKIDSLTDRLEMTLEKHRAVMSDERIKKMETDIAEQKTSNTELRSWLKHRIPEL